jgi:prepilin-type N-terminal cleavage/methylation domain-containing protein
MSGKTASRNVDQRGFTIVEVMMATAILGLAISAITIMLMNASSIKLAADHLRQVRAIAKEEEEDITYHFYHYDLLFAGSQNLIPNLYLDRSATNPGGIPATRNITIEVPNAPKIGGVDAPPYKRIKTTITWNENGINTSITLSRLITKVR